MAFDFRLPKRTERTCTKCGADFLGIRDLCDECSFYEDHPDMAPGYWTWTNGGARGWMVQAVWREKDPEPEPGTVVTVVTVNRKDGTTSQATLGELEFFRYDMAAQKVVVYSVQAR